MVRLDGSGRLWDEGLRPAWWRGAASLVRVEGSGGAWVMSLPVEVQVSGERAVLWDASPVGALVQ
ncbi:MAG: hypothetical protein ACK5LS_14135, partial [Propioniciclava sp.]